MSFTVLNKQDYIIEKCSHVEILNTVASWEQVHNKARQGEKEVEWDRKKGVEVQ